MACPGCGIECAALCRLCADAIARHSPFKTCAEACRKCAEACRKMAA
jgi:hypothetical protein